MIDGPAIRLLVVDEATKGRVSANQRLVIKCMHGPGKQTSHWHQNITTSTPEKFTVVSVRQVCKMLHSGFTVADDRALLEMSCGGQ